MNNPKRLPRPDAMRGLSSIERKFLCLARARRADYLRLLKRLKTSICKKGCSSLLLTACAVTFFATSTTNAQAGVSAPALFKEANAALRAEQPGRAILAYERARLLAPHDAAIEQNLRMAREKAGVSAPAISVWQRPAHWLAFDGWVMLGSSALLIGCALFLGFHYVPRRAARWIAASCGALLFLAVAAMGLRWCELDRAVIQTAGTSARIAPAANAQSVCELKAGELVTAKQEHGDFVFVRTLDQRSGWVNKSDVERVIPTTNPSPM
ncbi:MAG TPA: hypothetical protein VGO08_02795 [Burkholderiales bacterium]|nr:hypothetical protein [Burkholderiales bacterium]